MLNQKSLFHIPIISIDINDWENNKNKILNVFKKYPEKKTGIQNFYTNKNNLSTELIFNFADIFNEELQEITNFFKKDIKIKDVWTVTYKKGDFQPVHNHGSSGFTGIMYLDYCEDTPKTTFVQPWNDPIIDNTVCGTIEDIHEKIILVPSFVNHFSDPIKNNNKKRILSFDITL
jgi:hypothetical protein